MDDAVLYSLILLIFLAYGLVVYALYKLKKLEGPSLSLYGIFLMWKTSRGRKALEKIASAKRFWEAYGDFAIGLCIVGMFVVTGFLLWAATLVSSIPSDRVPPVQAMIGIPGLNPFIPIGYGVVALIVAIVIHEFAHGILTYVAKLKVLSLGVLFFIIPIGAFVEPDEEGLMKIDRRKRSRLFAVGPATNLIAALLFSFIFTSSMMASVTPVHDGVGVFAVVVDSPADGNITPGMMIFSFNGSAISDHQSFAAAVEGTYAGQNVTIGIYENGATRTINLTLADRFDFTQDVNDTGKGYLGVRTILIFTVMGTARTLEVKNGPDFFNPFADMRDPKYFTGSLFAYIGLPLLRVGGESMSPFPNWFTQFYEVEGFWSFLPADSFWILANVIYWIFWLNLMLGLTNVLPAVPLDGGYIFRDGLESVMERTNPDMAAEKREAYVRYVSYFLALFILALILWQIIGPRI
ncbi:MAG: site-2 protease family protein [Thermoplasmata archaeon]